jgi:ribosomal protein S11
MKIQEAAKIVIDHVEKRDAKLQPYAEQYALRWIGDVASRADLATAEDVASGRGPGSDSARRRLLRVAKAIAKAIANAEGGAE